MNETVDTRLHRLLGGEHLADLRRRLRGSLRRSLAGIAADRPPRQLRMARLSAVEHAALAGLTGRPQRPTSSMLIDLDLVDTAFREAGIAASLREALERLDGPIVDPVAVRAALRDRWGTVAGSCSNPDLAGLLNDRTGLGLLKRLARQDADTASVLCRQAEAILQRLPAQGIVRSQLAAETLGDAHALDAGQPVATLVLAARRRAGMPSSDAGDATEAELRRTIVRARDLWAADGVLVNELARPALFLNLPVGGTQEWGRGEPGYISLRRLLRAPPGWDVSGRDIHVCENPNLVAIAADTLGPDCAPLVCTDGMPAAAQRTLLGQLTRAGARLRYHGDFDWAGLRIGNVVMQDHGATPWRFGADDYLGAIAGQRSADLTAAASHLAGASADACWDPALTAAMIQHGTAMAEEAVAGRLLQDLAPRSAAVSAAAIHPGCDSG